MKNTFYTGLLYIVIGFLTVSCQEDAPAPECLKVEVVGSDCETGWFILKIENNVANSSQDNGYLGQLQSGYVTTDNLPEEYQYPGMKMEAALELNGKYAPRCVAVTVIHPAVKVTRVCSGEPIVN